MTPGQAAKQLGVDRRTTYNWVKKDQENPSDILELNNGKKVDRPSILNEAHKKHFISFYGDNPSAVVDQAMANLTSKFTGFKIGKTAVYNFMTNECITTFLGAISPFGIVNIQLRRPAMPSKKRRLGSNDLVANGAGGYSNRSLY